MTSIFVENIRCGGCVATITDKLKQNHQLSQINIDIKTGSVSIDDVDEETKLAVIETLKKMGYPLLNSIRGWDRKKVRAKSFISCAVGKLK